VIASGPTVPDESTFEDCLEIVEKYQIAGDLPASIMERLEAGARGEVAETPKPGDPCFESTVTFLAGSVADAACSIDRYAQDAGWACQYVTSRFQGEAREQGGTFLQSLDLAGLRAGCNVFLLSGELTVTIKGHGHGGRNQEMLLSAAATLPPQPPIVVLSAGMDGIEGNSPAAGAIIDNATASRAKKAKLSPQAFLVENNSYQFFRSLGDAVITGLTGTNVNDLTVALAWGGDDAQAD
jgi:glycerate-2-kinase